MCFLSQIRFFFKSKEKGPYLFWYRILGFPPNDLKLYDEALSHKSARIMSHDNRLVSNERLEYLGDAILSSIISEILFKKFPDENEGFLTNIRSRIVCRENLNRLAKELGFAEHIKSKNIATHVENIYGNALEALIGAVYIDRGYGFCRQFIENKMLNGDLVDLNKILKKETNSKSRLLEWGQKNRKTVVFELVEERVNTSTNQHLFLYNILIDGKVFTRSSGATKQQAQQSAAKTALNKLKGTSKNSPTKI